MRPVLPAILAVLPAVLPALVEPQVADLRLLAEARPVRFDFTWSDARRTVAGSDAFDSALAAGLGARWGLGAAGRPHALLLGLDLLGEDDRQSGLERRAALARAGAGWAVGLHQRWTLALRPEAALVRSRARLRSGAAGDFSLDGGGWEASLAAGVRFGLDRRWSLGLDGAWLWTRERLDGDGASLDLRRAGPALALSLCWTLDARPRPLAER